MLRAKLVNWWYGFGGGSSAESTVRGRARWVWTPTRQTQTMILSPFASTPFATVKMRRRAGKVHRRTGADLERGKDKWRVAADNGPVEGQQAAAETRYVAKTATQTNDTNDNLTESQQVQRELALRVMEAQTRWIRAPGKSKKKKPPKGDDDAGTHASSSSAASDDVTSAEDAVGTAADTVVGEAWERGRWLLGLLVLQSSSSVVLQHYGDLVRDNLIITLFLTMLVGAGGNAGNQSAIRVIRGLATGDMVVTKECFVDTLWQQARVGFLLATFLSLGGFARVMITEATGGLDGGSVEDAAGARRRGRGLRERSVRGGGRVRHRAVAVLHSHAEHRRGDGDAVRARRHRPGPRQRGHHDPGIHGRHGRGHHVRGVFGGVHAVSRGVNGGGWIE